MLAYWMITASLLAAGCGYIVGRLASAHVWQDEVGRLTREMAERRRAWDEFAEAAGREVGKRLRAESERSLFAEAAGRLEADNSELRAIIAGYRDVLNSLQQAISEGQSRIGSMDQDQGGLKDAGAGKEGRRGDRDRPGGADHGGVRAAGPGASWGDRAAEHPGRPR